MQISSKKNEKCVREKYQPIVDATEQATSNQTTDNTKQSISHHPALL
jgi:hypothetical protein